MAMNPQSRQPLLPECHLRSCFSLARAIARTAARSRVLVFSLALRVVVSPPALAASGPVAWWRFDDGAGTVARDSSGNGFDAQIRGSTTWAGGVSNGALRFGGSAYADVPFDARLQLGSALTLQAWIQPTDTSPNTYQRIVEMWDSYILRLDNPPENSKLSFFTFLNSNPEPRLSFSMPALQQWHQVFAVWDGTNMSLWLDGAKRTAPRAGPPTPKPNTLRLGQHFLGAIDEVKIYDRALTDDEILAQVPPKLVSVLHVAQPIGDLGRPLAISCTLSNAGGQPLENGSVELALPPGVRLVSGTSLLPVPSVTRTGAVTMRWEVQADFTLATHLHSVVRFPAQPAATNVVGVVIARPPPISGPLLTQPALTRNGNDLILGNHALRLVFPSNNIGYGVFAVDVNPGNTWRWRWASAGSGSIGMTAVCHAGLRPTAHHRTRLVGPGDGHEWRKCSGLLGYQSGLILSEIFLQFLDTRQRSGHSGVALPLELLVMHQPLAYQTNLKTGIFQLPDLTELKGLQSNSAFLRHGLTMG